MANKNDIRPCPLGVPNSVVIHSGKPGPVDVIFGGIHGNEPCGLHAINRLLFDFATERRVIKRGMLVMAEGNHEACQVGVRSLIYNLNRLFLLEYGIDIDQTCYEYRRAQELKQFLAMPNHFLCLHSTSSAGESFFLTGQQDLEFIRRVGGAKIVTGWDKFGGVLGGTTEAYARANNVVSATFEAGQHDLRCTLDAAYRTAVRFLTVAGLIEENEEDYRYEEAPEVFDITGMWTKRTAECHYVRDVRNFMPLRLEHQVVDDGAALDEYPRGEFLIMPTSHPQQAKIGEEVYFVGNKVG